MSEADSPPGTKAGRVGIMFEKVSDLGSLSWLRGFGDKDLLSAFSEHISRCLRKSS